MENKLSEAILSNTACSYITLMSNLGKNNTNEDISLVLSALFSEDIVKIENGKIITSGQEELMNQLINAQESAAPWDMTLQHTLTDKKNREIVIFTWNSKIIGQHITTVILRLNKNHKIYEIVEVYNRHS